MTTTPTLELDPDSPQSPTCKAAESRPANHSPSSNPTNPSSPEGSGVSRTDNALPVFNPLSYDGGRCEACRIRPQAFYLSCYTKSGAHLPNRFVCAECLPQAQQEARAAGRFDQFAITPPPADQALILSHPVHPVQNKTDRSAACPAP